MARTYRRDSQGRFASGGGRSARAKARSAPRGTNRLTRDNAGRITSVGGEGATARGGRLRTAGGKLRATQTARISGSRAGTIGKPQGLKPQEGRKLRTGIALSRMRKINAKAANRPDNAVVNIKGRFKGQAGKRMDAQISRAAKEAETYSRRQSMKPKDQVKQNTRTLKSLRSAHESDIIASLKKKTGKPASEIRSFLRGRLPAEEIKIIRRWVGEKRSDPELLATRRSRATRRRR